MPKVAPVSGCGQRGLTRIVIPASKSCPQDGRRRSSSSPPHIEKKRAVPVELGGKGENPSRVIPTSESCPQNPSGRTGLFFPLLPKLSPPPPASVKGQARHGGACGPLDCGGGGDGRSASGKKKSPSQRREIIHRKTSSRLNSKLADRDRLLFHHPKSH